MSRVKHAIVLHWTPGEPVVQLVELVVLSAPTRRLPDTDLAALAMWSASWDVADSSRGGS